MQRWIWTAIGPVVAGAVLWMATIEATAPAPQVLRGPYLQMGTPTSMVIVVRTDVEIDPIVRFGKDLDKLEGKSDFVDLRYPTEGAPEGRAALHSSTAMQYEIHLTGLDAETTYYYAVFDGENRLVGGDDAHTFRTSPKVGYEHPIRFWVVGDSGTGQRDQAAVFQALEKYRDDQGLALDGYLHVGDMAYPDGKDDEFQRKFFDVYAPLLKQTVCWPSMGNHEGHTSNGNTGIGPYYDAYVVPTDGEAGGVPSGTEAYYSFDYGPVHFICLDSHDLDRSSGGAMAQWLTKDLASTDAAWIIGFWHHPPYTKGTHNSDTEKQLIEMRNSIMPILEKGGIDLVLSGHSHTYERSMLIDGAYATPTIAENVVLDDGDGRPDGDGAYQKPALRRGNAGTIAVVTGHGGAGIGRLGTSPIMRETLVEHGSVLLEFTEETLNGTMLDRHGRERDHFQIQRKRGHRPSKPIAEPWQPMGPILHTGSAEPGQPVEVTMTPRPNAPDACVHYTLDGSEPTTSSPKYTNPLNVEGPTQVRAITVWDNGRTTPPASLRVDPIPDHARRYTIGSSAGDAEEKVKDGKVSLDSGDLELGADGTPQLVGLRYEGIDLVKADDLEAAYLHFYVKQATSKETKVTILGEKTLGALPFRVDAKDLSNRARTDTMVAWTIPTWLDPGTELHKQTSPDISPILKEIASLEEWHEGGPVVLFIVGTGTRYAWSFDGRSDAAPVLELVFKK